MTPSLIWFRSDLRVHDNTALAAAAAEGPVVAIFLRSTDQWREHGHGANKLDFWQRGVLALRDALHGLGIPLLHRDIENFAAAPDVLLTIAGETGAHRLHFNHEYPLNERQRDINVTAAFEKAGLTTVGHHDSVTFAPGELRTGKGEFYSVFTPFAKAWHRQLTPQRLALHDTPDIQTHQPIPSDPAPEPPALDLPPAAPDDWPAGESPAADRLERFLRLRARHYSGRRDFPAEAGTSSLSPYLALGMLSHRQCMQAVLAENDGGLAEGDAGLTTWISELIWREFYQHVAFGFPDVCRYRAFQTHTEALAWRDDAASLQAWQEGRTGYPLVDAAMRQLLATGWMHNRLRMVTAMFLAKHLLIDWRHGERFFLRHLVDGEFAANNGGWQWAASTGTDAVPYFRIFNPTTQSRRFDPDGRFIAQWLPELADLPAKARHDPSPEQRAFRHYPPPIVEHRAARLRALEAFKGLSR